MLEYLDRPTSGWFVREVMRTREPLAAVFKPPPIPCGPYAALIFPIVPPFSATFRAQGCHALLWHDDGNHQRSFGSGLMWAYGCPDHQPSDDFLRRFAVAFFLVGGWISSRA